MDVLNILKSRQHEIKQRFRVKRIGLFGSFARGEAGPQSDVDILVELDRLSFRNFMNLAFFLEDLFQRKVDLVTPEGLSPYIRPYVEKEVVWSE